MKFLPFTGKLVACNQWLLVIKAQSLYCLLMPMNPYISVDCSFKQLHWSMHAKGTHHFAKKTGRLFVHSMWVIYVLGIYPAVPLTGRTILSPFQSSTTICIFFVFFVFEHTHLPSRARGWSQKELLQEGRKRSASTHRP